MRSSIPSSSSSSSNSPSSTTSVCTMASSSSSSSSSNSTATPSSSSRASPPASSFSPTLKSVINLPMATKCVYFSLLIVSPSILEISFCRSGSRIPSFFSTNRISSAAPHNTSCGASVRTPFIEDSNASKAARVSFVLGRYSDGAPSRLNPCPVSTPRSVSVVFLGFFALDGLPSFGLDWRTISPILRFCTLSSRRDFAEPSS
mmetsp:Transcript_4116/g.11820  ORF Transcript_4116/g.11820 Transcript_4116/m.11820 type:complete len:203 (-) Transcript_4116:208-816(-)